MTYKVGYDVLNNGFEKMKNHERRLIILKNITWFINFLKQF